MQNNFVSLSVKQACVHMKLDLGESEDEIIDMAVSALMEDAGVVITNNNNNNTDDDDDDNDRHNTTGTAAGMTREQFYDIFHRHPELMRCFEDEDELQRLKQSVRSSVENEAERAKEEEENEQVWHRYNTEWKNKFVEYIWLLLYIGANTAAFTVKAMSYASNEEATAVFGGCIVGARGAAACLNLNAMLVLLPICRHVVTWFRCTPLAYYAPFDASLEAHILIGIAILLFSTAHVCSHICDIYRFAFCR